MPSLPDPREAQFAKLPRLTVRLAVHHHFGVSRLAEVVLARPIRYQQNLLAAWPAADHVRIAIHERDLYVPLEQLLQMGQVGVSEIAGEKECVVDLVAGGVVQLDAKAVLDWCGVQVFLRMSAPASWGGR